MGSRFTILNDTRHDVLVKHAINCQLFIRPVDVLHAGLIYAAQGRDLIPLEFINGVLERLLDMLNREVEEDRNDMSSAKLIKPGEKYTWLVLYLSTCVSMLGMICSRVMIECVLLALLQTPRMSTPFPSILPTWMSRNSKTA